MGSRESAGQRLVRRNPLVATPLAVLMFLALAGVVFEVVRANQPATRLARNWPWTMETLGTTTWTALFIAAGVVWVARDQFARSARPLLRYESLWRREIDSLLDAEPPFREVVLRNVGPGPAVISDVRWIVRAASAREDSVLTTIGAVHDALARQDLRESRDYHLVNFTSGAAIAPGEVERYFVCTEAGIKALARFDVVLRFDSTLGDRYERRIWLLPHPGASTAIVEEPRTA